MEYCFKASILVLAALSFTACKFNEFAEGQKNGNVISFVVGNDNVISKSSDSDNGSEAQIASYGLGETDGNEFTLVETVSSIDNLYSFCEPITKGTPVYTENFDSLYGEEVYATAFAPEEGDRAKLTEAWGSYLGDGGTVNLKLTDDHTYSFNYSDGPCGRLQWPESGSVIYFIQAPYSMTKTLSPEYYNDGSIEFDYTDPTTPTDVEGRPTIVNGAAAQKDILFTSKLINQPPKEQACVSNVLMYHALTAVKFKAGLVDTPAGRYATNTTTDIYAVSTDITKVTIKGLKAKGHCTILPNFTDANISVGGNPNNINGNALSKSSTCSTWAFPEEDSLIADYSQSFTGTVDYSGSNSSFADSFYDGSSNLSNLGTATDGSEILLLIPQENSQVELVIDFTLTSGSTVREFQRSVKVNVNWKAGELHTYELTINKVDVDIIDTMDETLHEKTGIITKNTGNVTSYLRASYAIAWYYGYDEDAIIVAAYQGHGHFIGLPGTNWIEGEDGYFYYKYPIMPGHSSDYSLFSKFTAPSKSEEAPFPGAHLELKLLLQGVQYDENKVKVMAAWGNVKVKGSGVYVVDQLDFIPENYGI